MFSVRQFGNAIAYRSRSIAAKVVLEIIVQRISLRHVSINNQLQVMTDAATCCIDAILVVQLSHEVRRRIDATSIDKRLTIQIAIDIRSRSIVWKRSRTAHLHLIANTAGLHSLIVADGIEVDESVCIGIADILRNSKSQRESSVLHRIITIEEHVLTVVVHKGIFSLRWVIQLTNHPFERISHYRRQRAIESCSGLSVLFQDMSTDGCCRSCIQYLCLTHR